MDNRWRSTAVVAVLLVFSYGAQADALCEREQSRSRETALRIDQEWPQHPSNHELSRYVQSLGERLGRISPSGRSIPWRFTVLRDHSPYAFAIGSGFVYVADGAFGFARNESELAAILAHEIGHQLAAHFCEPDSEGRGRYDPSAVRRDSVGSLTQVIDPRKELEADQYAIDVLREAGFDPHAMLEVAKRLPIHSGSEFGRTENWRVLAIQDRLRKSPFGSAGIQDSNEFQRLKKQLSGH